MKKIVIILAVLLVAFLGAAEFYVQTDGFTDLVRPYLTGPLREVLGPEARLGDVKANFLPPRLEVRDIVINDATGKPAATIRKIIVYINPLPLVFKKIRLPSITVLEPRVFTRRAQDGSFPILPLIERIKSNLARQETGGSGGFSLLLRSVTVQKGEIWFVDEALKSSVSVTGLSVSTRFNLAKDRVMVNLRGSHVSAVAPGYPALRGELRASAEYNQGRLLLQSSEFSMEDASLTVQGETGVFPDPDLRFKGRIVTGPQVIGRFADIFKPRPKQQGPRAEAAFEVRGRASDPEVNGEAKFSGLFYHEWTLRDASLTFQYKEKSLLLGGGNWHIADKEKTLTLNRIGAALSYPRGVLGIDHLEIAAGDLVLRMHGTVDPAKGFALSATAASSGGGNTIDFISGLPVGGTISMEGDLTGAVTAPRFRGMVAAGPVVVRGVEFDEVKGALALHDGKLTLSSVDVRRQASRYVLDGDIDFSGKEPVYSAHARVIRSDVASIVALFYEQLPLELSAHGDLSFQGTAHAYSGSASLSSDAGKAYGESFTRAAVTASLTTGKISFPQVVVYKRDGVIKGSGWISFDGNYSADCEGTGVGLSSVDTLKSFPLGGNASFTIHSSGTFDAPRVQSSLDIENLSVRNFSAGRAHLAADIDDGRMKVRVEIPENRALITMLWTLHKPFAWNAVVDVNLEDVDPFLALGQPDLQDRLNVQVQASAALRGRGLDHTAVSGEAVFQRILLTLGDYRLENEAASRVSFERGVATIRSFSLTGPGTHIGVSGTVTEKAPDLALRGTFALSLLKTFFPEVEYASGSAEMQVTAREDWSNPAIAGVLHIRQGEVKVRDVPQKVGGINGVIILSHEKITAESLTGEVGGGTMTVSGGAQFAGTALKDYSFKSSVDNVTIRYPEGLTSTVSGNLFFDGNAGERTLSGDVQIKRARYEKRIEWKSMLVDIGRGLYQKKKADIGWIGDTEINVRFHGSDNILFQNNLAQLELEIDVFLRGTVNHPQLLGRVESRKGTVYFRKNEFKILHASADFVDPNRMNPVLDIQAETQVREYLISLAITGTADRASVTLISDPALADTDILSMLALGKKGAELKGKETTVGVGEAASFATGQFQDIFERRARSLTGLDRFQVDPYVSKNDTSVPRVTVGKELVQSKLYVTYSSNVGATVPEQIFRIEYLLDKHFSLIGERNELGNYGADVKFRFEFR